jgi:hypothetical protein
MGILLLAEDDGVEWYRAGSGGVGVAARTLLALPVWVICLGILLRRVDEAAEEAQQAS